MRELTNSELNHVSGAGIVTDDPGFKEQMDNFDKACEIASLGASEFDSALGQIIDAKLLVTPGASMANQSVHGAVDVIDAALTGVSNTLDKFFKSFFG